MAQPVVVSSCINYKWKYDVFLSFRGEDTRLGFVGFLRESLCQRGIRVFYDDDSIRTGEEITPALFKAIQESRIAIIVFSENYAKSTFCLRELEKILECFIEEDRLVYPVFYHVDPSELRRPKGSYAKALARLEEERFKDDKQKVEKWRRVLSQASNLKGCHLKSKISNEQECVDEIIDEVSANINHNRNPLHVTNYPVGLVSRVNQVVSLLDLWSEKKNKMVGIVGPGGIGKSTIARATYNFIGDHFEGLCFLFNVRQKSAKPSGLAHLQEALLCKLVMEKDLKLGDIYEGIPKIKHRLGHKKILLILDDVDELEQLQALAGNCSWFGLGSRIVITTRNKHLLASHDVNDIYHVGELNDEESLQLLSWHASRTENVNSNFDKVSKRAIRYSCGFPIALKVIGSNLRNKGVDEWKSALDQYKRVQEQGVFGVLRLSYDSLTEIQRSFFLDLACFSNGVKLEEVMDMLSCLRGFEPKYDIGVLIDKSLIKIEGDHVLMHDLIEDMGKEIVRQESPNESGKRSRLWCYQDILHVLKHNTGIDKVEVIVLDVPGGSEAQIQWSGDAFMKMENLKMLVINNASFSTCPTHLPQGLRWLKWKGYSFKFLPDISSTELFCLDLSCSYFDTLQPFTKMFHTLSCMNLRNCESLQQIPDLSGVSYLRYLWLDGCTNLVEIHHSVGRLNKLKELSAMRCNNLEILPPDLCLTSLEQLNLFGCSSLYSFPDILVEMKYIQTLDIGRTAITVLPPSMCNLIGLETLNMEECPNLHQLPPTIYLLPNLWALNANFSKLMTHFERCEGVEENLGCHALPLKLRHFCFSNCNLSNDSLALCLSYFTNMIRLDLSFNKFTTLPACIKECHHLRYLLLDNCKQLRHIKKMPPNLEKFSAICCKSLTKSSKSKVLYQALNLKTGKTNFILPGGEFPENLDNYSRGSCVSFWVRGVFPTIFLWIVVKHDQDFLSNCTFLIHVNDTKLDISCTWHLLSTMKMGHLYICDLQSMIHKAELGQRNRWNHVKVSIKSNTQETKSGRDQFDLALHVYKQQNNSDTIRFMDPKTVYADSNSWQRVRQPQDWEELEDDVPYRVTGLLHNFTMNGIKDRKRVRNTVSAIGEMARELEKRVKVQLSAETVTGSLRNFTDLEEKYSELNQQWLWLSTLRADTEREVQRCREKVTTSSYDIWITQASDVDVQVNVLLTRYEGIQASSRVWERINLSSDMEQMIGTIKRLVNEKISMVFLVDSPPERVLKELNAPRIAGYPTLQGALEKALELVKNSKIKAIGVHGLKGVGKTAIMQNLNNHEEVAKLFDIVIFVSVSDDDEETHIKVQQKIARRLKVDTKGIDTEDIARKIHEELKNKKYLLILDGVVDFIDLTQLGIPNDDNDSKVMLTAQHQQGCTLNEVDRLVKVDQLSRNEAWKMFRDTVGPIIDQPDIPEIAQRVCDKCSCLPLLIHKIARSFKLKQSVESWRSGLEDLEERWPDYENEGENEFYSFLKFCYDELKDEKKQKCFLYTSLYPTEKVYSDHLVECLAAQDFLGDINGTRKYQNARDRGYAILEHLTHVSLLDKGKQMIYVSMNACMKQLASYIFSKDPHSSYVQTKEELERYERAKSWQKAKWVSLIDSNLQTLPTDQDCSMLETLFLQRNPALSKIPPTFFKKHMRNLLVLDLYDTGIRNLPSSVSKLIGLRGLYLNDCKHLTLLNCGSLERLEFLDIRGTKVSFLSYDIGYLTNLRCLRIPYFKNEDEAAHADYGALSRLQKLEELIIEVVSYQEWRNDAANVMEQLASLENLTSLGFSFPTSSILENLLTRRSGKQFSSFRFFVGCQNSRRPSILECFEYRISKYLRYNGGCEDTLAISVVLPQTEALELVNRNHIRDLSILGTESLKCIRGILIEKCNEIHAILPRIVNGTRAVSILPNLEQLHLINLPKLNCVFGGPLHEESLSKLRVLILKDCSSLKYIFGDGAIQHFSELHLLKVQNCSDFEELIAAADCGSAVLPELQELVLTNLPRLGSVCLDQALPWSSLEVLKIYKCSNLRSLPLSKGEATNLRSIEGEQEWWDQLQWTDKEHFQEKFKASSEY